MVSLKIFIRKTKKLLHVYFNIGILKV